MLALNVRLELRWQADLQHHHITRSDKLDFTVEYPDRSVGLIIIMSLLASVLPRLLSRALPLQRVWPMRRVETCSGSAKPHDFASSDAVLHHHRAR